MKVALLPLLLLLLLVAGMELVLSAHELSQVQLSVKDKGVLLAASSPLVLDKGQVLEVSFLLGGICPDHATLALINPGNGKDVQFPFSCSGGGASKLALPNTIKLSEELGYPDSSALNVDLVLIVSDDKLEAPIQRQLGKAEISLFARPEKKELPLFATSLLHESDTTRVALPEIHHKFREPDRRAPKFIALVFALLQLAWLLALNYVFAVKAKFTVINVFTGGAGLLFFAAMLTTIELVFLWYWIGVAGAPNMENLTYKFAPPLLLLLTIASKAAMSVSGESKKKVASM